MASNSSKLRFRWVTAVSCSETQGVGPDAWGMGGFVSHNNVDPSPAPTVLSVTKIRHRSNTGLEVSGDGANNSCHGLPGVRSGRVECPSEKQLSSTRKCAGNSVVGIVDSEYS